MRAHSQSRTPASPASSRHSSQSGVCQLALREAMQPEPGGIGGETSESPNCLFNGSKWGGPDIVAVLPHTWVAQGRRRKEIRAVGGLTWQLLGEAMIDGDALGSVSIWTWLTLSRTEHLSLTAMQEEWGAHREQRQRFYLDRHLGNVLQRRSDYLFAAIFKEHPGTTSDSTLNQRGVEAV